MTKVVRNLAAAAMLCSAVALIPAAAQAQGRSTSTGFDGYRALAISAGVVVGAVVAVVVTDGLIIPVYAWATGAGSAAAGGGAMAGSGAMAGGGAMAGAAPAAAGYGLLRGGMRLFGAISGGLFADGLYTGK